jgi:hypothetical protein
MPLELPISTVSVLTSFKLFLTYKTANLILSAPCNVAVNNFSKDAVDETNENSNLEQAREAISQAKGNLDQIVKMLDLDPTSAIS